jgi:lycopene cyclase domain-containing protein
VSILYLATLVVAIGCMALIDHRYRLFFWQDARRATIVLALGLAFFLVWDFFGIGLGIFFRGETAIMTGILLASELPLEEPFFLAFLCYLTMVLITGVGRAVMHQKETRT